MPVDVAQSHLAAQRLHTHRTPAMPAAQRWVALGHKLVGNGLQRPASTGQCLNAGAQAGVITALPVARNGTYEHALRLAAPTQLTRTCTCSRLPCASPSTPSTRRP